MYAVDWLRVLMAPGFHPDDVIPGMLIEEDQDFLEDLIHAEEVTLYDIQEWSLEAISVASGRPWWVALRLVGLATKSWDAMGGEMMMAADPTRLSLAGWLDIFFLQALRHMEEDKRTMFLMKLELAPEGRQEEAAPLEMSASAFMAMA